MAFHVPEQFRVLDGPLASTPSIGNNGYFLVRSSTGALKCIVSDELGWEHVSVSRPNRCPTWEEMCLVKDLFWDAEDTVIQFHPPKSEYVNNHKYCLHLFRPVGVEIARPPSILVGDR